MNKCHECGNEQFTEITINIGHIINDEKPNSGMSGFGLESYQSAGDLKGFICNKCHFVHFFKPDYWSFY